MPERDIVITGMGLLTPLGQSVEENWRNLKSKKPGIGWFPNERHPEKLHYFGKISRLRFPDNVPQKLLNQMKFLNRGALLGFVAAHEALAQSHIDASDFPPERRGLYIGSGDFTKVGYDFMFPATEKGTGGKQRDVNYRLLNESCLHDVNPFFLLESIHNNLFTFLSAFFELKGPNTCLASLSPCGLHALELACRTIRQDQSDMAVVVGCGSWITEIPLYEIEGIGLISRCREGVYSFKPFDKQRDGFITGEGGAALLLEDMKMAKRRGAPILGKVKGSGNCMELSPFGGFALPSMIGKRSIEMALKEGGRNIADLAFINPHGSGTQKGDKSELQSLKELLDGKRSDIPICGMKPYTGHLGAASDIAEVIFGVKAIREGMAPATLNFKTADEEFSGLRISGSHLTCNKNHFFSLSYGMGGQSSAVLVEA